MKIDLQRWPILLLAAILAASSPPGLLAADDAPVLTIVDEHGTAHALTAAEWAKLPRKTVSVPDGPEKTTTAEYQGVALSDALQHCGVVLGKDLRGPRVANYVLLEASDGYRVALSIGEVDPATTDKLIVLADRKNGEALPEREGALRLVIPDEKRPVRWIRMLKKISIRSAATEAK